jgi:hypothetical protein
VSTTDTSVADAEALCPALASDPTGPYPSQCANFNQLGVRVPFIAVSPFSKPAYVSHVGVHTSILALIERRFPTINGGVTLRLTKRDQFLRIQQPTPSSLAVVPPKRYVELIC